MRFHFRDHDGIWIEIEQLENGTFRYRHSAADSWTSGLTDTAKEKVERNLRWIQGNRDGMEAYNRYIEEHGLPLADFRKF